MDSNNRRLLVVSFTTFENELLRKAVFSTVQIHLALGGASALEASKATLEEDGTSLCAGNLFPLNYNFWCLERLFEILASLLGLAPLGPGNWRDRTVGDGNKTFALGV